uniref:Uncharacterized protein n=1 Tax=Dicentrarchus labrax TaxID=13489 RepID=A0A8C4DHQ5_DICLA
MSSVEYIHYRGIDMPTEAHTMESLEYAQNFSVEDTDVFSVTYPKSGTLKVQQPPFGPTGAKTQQSNSG